MKFVATLALLTLTVSAVATRAQAPSLAPALNDSAQLELVVRKLDEQNTKIDALSQHILKVEQQLNARPGVMIGESTPAAPAPAVSSPTTASAPAVPPGANTHVVARGETLTSIAKMHKVTVDELQKFNHIENDRKLQAGQTILIPPTAGNASPAGSAASSATPTPAE